MISASALSSRWAAGTAALLLAGGSALPDADVEPREPDPAPAVDVPAAETPGPAEDPLEWPVPDSPVDDDPTGPPAEQPPADEPPVAETPTEEPVVDTPTEEPVDEPAAEETPTEEPEQAGPTLVVVPEPVPSVVDGAPGYLLPLGEGGFTWLVDGVRVDELGATARLVESPDGSWYELSAVALGTDVERLVLAVVAAPGHALLGSDGTTSLVRVVLDPRAATELVTPTALDGEGREDAVVVPDAVTQVVRDAAGEVLDAGTHPVTAEYVDGVATVALTVSAADGYRLEVDGTPVETVPGAGGTSTVALVLTAVPPPEPVPSPAETPAVPRSPVLPVREKEPEQQLELAAPLITVPVVATPEPAAIVPSEEPAEAAAIEELPESGPEGLGLMVMLGGLLLGGSWLVLGMRGD